MAMAVRWPSLPREEAAAIYRRLYWLRPRFDEVAERAPRGRGRAVRYRRQHGTGGRRHLSPAGADRAQSRRQGLSRPGAGRPRRPGDAGGARRFSGGARQARAARRCCCARSKRCKASDTSAWPKSGQPMRRFYMAGWRTVSVRHKVTSVTLNAPHRDFVNFVNLKEDKMAIIEAIVGPVSKLLDKIIPDPRGARPRQAGADQAAGRPGNGGDRRADAGDRRRGAVVRPLDQPRPAELPLCHVRADPVGDPDGPDRRGRSARWRSASATA